MLSGFNPQEIQDLEGARQAIVSLLNLVEALKQENQALRSEVQRLRDEISRLKGEQGKPAIKANKSKAQDHSSEKERRKAKRRHKGRKVDQIIINREEKLYVDKRELPSSAPPRAIRHPTHAAPRPWPSKTGCCWCSTTHTCPCITTPPNWRSDNACVSETSALDRAPATALSPGIPS
jgi:hypothetical protein